MRETCTSGSEGGEPHPLRLPYPYQNLFEASEIYPRCRPIVVVVPD